MARARKVLKNETIAIIGYGVQGPAQSLNLRDNGFKVIIGQASAVQARLGPRGQGRLGAGQDPVRDRRGRAPRHHHPDAGVGRRPARHLAGRQEEPQARRRALFLARLLDRLQEADRGGPAEERGRHHGGAEGLGHLDVRRNFLTGAGINSSFAVEQDATGPRRGTLPGRRHRHRLGLPVPDHVPARGVQRSDRRTRRADGRAGGHHGGAIRRAARPRPHARAKPSTKPSRNSRRASSGWWTRTAWTGCIPTAPPPPSAARWTGSRVSRRPCCRCSRNCIERVKTGKECARVLSACGAPNYQVQLQKELEQIQTPRCGGPARPSARCVRRKPPTPLPRAPKGFQAGPRIERTHAVILIRLHPAATLYSHDH